MASFESDEIADEYDYETQSMFHRSARSLPLNSVDDLLNLKELLLKLCQNIINNPTEEKFHSIKLSNKSIQNRLINRKGGVEFLAAIGFVSIFKDGEKYLSVYENNDENVDNKINIKIIEDGIIWLNETVETCLLMSNITANSKNLAQSKSIIKPCAECIIQIRLSTGQAVIGGFMREDKVSDVLSFAQTFFKAERANEVILRHTHNSTEINSFDFTLVKASLFPRAILVASTQSKEIRLTKVQQVFFYYILF
jgi:hypothetical protein